MSRENLKKKKNGACYKFHTRRVYESVTVKSSSGPQSNIRIGNHSPATQVSNMAQGETTGEGQGRGAVGESATEAGV